jgi:DNA-binding ferritin-like protein (Dps family)
MLDIYEDIKKYIEGQTVHGWLQRDSALGNIIKLLNENRIYTQEMFRLKGDMDDVDFSRKDDESWVI